MCKHPSERWEMLIGNMSVFKKHFEKFGGTVERVKPDVFTHFAGVPIKYDPRVPDGVWLMVPHGEDMSHPNAQVGTVSSEYAESARTFRHLLDMAGSPRRFDPVPMRSSAQED